MKRRAVHAVIGAGSAFLLFAGCGPTEAPEPGPGPAEGGVGERYSLENAAFDLDETQAIGGEPTVRFDIAGKGAAFSVINEPETLAIEDGALQGRALVWLEDTPDGDVHWTLIEAEGRRASDGEVALVRIGGQHPVEVDGEVTGSRLMTNYETPSGYSDPDGMMSDCWRHADDPVVMPAGRWVCVGWRFDPDGDDMGVWLDGVEVASLRTTGRGQGCLHQPEDFAWEMPEFETLRVGWETYSEDAPRTIWIGAVEPGAEPSEACPLNSE